LAALRHRSRRPWRRPQYPPGDARARRRHRERAALRISRRHTHDQSALCLRGGGSRLGVSRGPPRDCLLRRGDRGAGPVARHAMDRHRQGDPPRCQGEARRRALRRARRPRLVGPVRARHRLPGDRRLSADPDLLRQPGRRQRLRPDRLHHRRARRHGLGGGRADRRALRRRGREPVRSLSRGIARPDRNFRDVHPGPAVPPRWPVRRAGMRGLAPILLATALLAAVPLITSSNVVLNFLVVALLIALVGQGWNLLGGYGGQYSFGHAAFFGTGAYVTAVLQMRYGVNAWLAFGIGIVAGALTGAAIGALSFRSG